MNYPKQTMLEALELAHAEIKKIVQKIDELAQKVGRGEAGGCRRSRSIPSCRPRSRRWWRNPFVTPS